MPKINSQKGSVEISTIVAIIIVAVTIATVSIYVMSKYYEDLKVVAPVAVITPKATLTSIPAVDETANWKTYTNDKYGFAIKYPINFYTKENYLSALYQIDNSEIDSIITLSNNTKFEKDESSFLLSIENIDEYNGTVKQYINDETVQFVAEKLGLDLLKKSLNTKIVGTFKGNPPWGYYSLYFKNSNDQNKGLLLAVRSHQENDLNLFKQILSTFKFIGNNEVAGFIEKTL